MGQHHAFLHASTFPSRHQIGLSEELTLVYLLRVFFVILRMRLWIDDEPFYFLPKATLMYFSALEDRNTSAFCPFMQNSPRTGQTDYQIC